MKVRRFLLSTLLFTLAMIPPGLWGQGLIPQTSLEESAPAEEDSIVLRPFPAVRITEAFASSGNLITQSAKKHFTQVDIAMYTSEVDTLTREIDTFLGQPNIGNLEGLGVRDLDQIISRTRVFFGRIDQQQEKLSKVALELGNESELLYENSERWRLTLDSQDEKSTPASRIERMLQTIQRLDSVRTLLQEDLALILEGQDVLADRRNKLEEVVDSSRQMIDALGKTLMRITAPGFFEELSNLGDPDLLNRHVDKLKSTFRNDYETLKWDYLRAMIIAAVFLLLLLALSIWFKKNYPSVISEETFALSETNKTIIHLPVATSVILVTLMIRLLLYEIPQTFFYLNVLILSIPMATFAIRFFGKRIRLWIIVLLVLYNLYMLYELAYHPGPLIRIFQMLTCLVEIWLFAWLYRNRPFHKDFGKHSLYGLFRGLVFVFVLIPILGIIVNLIGAFRLAEFLSAIPLTVFVSGIAFLVFIRLADSIIYTLLSSRLMQKIYVIKEDAVIIHNRLVRLVNIFFLLFFLTVILRLFMVKDAVFAWVERLLTEGKKIGNLDFTVGNILIFFVVIWLSIVITRIIIRILEKDVYTRVATAKGVPATISLLLRITLITGGIFPGRRRRGDEADQPFHRIGGLFCGDRFWFAEHLQQHGIRTHPGL
jgi:potassium efflux system protein